MVKFNPLQVTHLIVVESIQFIEILSKFPINRDTMMTTIHFYKEK